MSKLRKSNGRCCCDLCELRNAAGNGRPVLSELRCIYSTRCTVLPVLRPGTGSGAPKIWQVKNRAGLLAIFLGQFGIHNFYLGYTNRAVTQLLVSILLSWTFVAPLGIWIWAIVEAVKIFQGEIPDADGRPLSD